jgi:hypothetical protein
MPWSTWGGVPSGKIGGNQDLVQLKRSCVEGNADFIGAVTLYSQLSNTLISQFSFSNHEILQTKNSVTKQFDLPHQIGHTESEVKSPATTDMYESNCIV